MDEIKTDLKEVRAHLTRISDSQIRMEEDVKHHIARTDKLQDMVTPMWTAYTAVKWIAAVIVGTGAVVAASKILF